jgi:hypothetical protein
VFISRNDFIRVKGTYSSHVSIDGGDTFVGFWLQQLGCDELLDGENDAVLAADADGGTAILDSLHGIFDLEVAAVGGEDGVLEIVTRPYRGLEAQVSIIPFVL